MKNLKSFMRINLFFRCRKNSPKIFNEVIKRDYLIDRIRAKNRINWLLDEENVNCRGESNCETEALNLALNYKFVTPVTSLIVEESNEYITSGKFI